MNRDPKPGLYRHFRGGLYRMFAAAWPAPMPLDGSSFFTYLWSVKHTETGILVAVYCENRYDGCAPRYWTFGTEFNERLVIYQSQADGSYWARPLEMWHDKVDGVPRFIPVEVFRGEAHA